MSTVDWDVFTGHSDLLAETSDEMQAQIRRWKPINGHAHPLIGGKPAEERSERQRFAFLEAHYQDVNATRATDGELGWDSILLEEVFEALRETDPEKMVVELVQCAAVALSAAHSIRRHGPYGKARS